MNFTVHNYGLHVDHVRITGVSSSSLFLVGDMNKVKLSSMYDTPPESYVVTSNVPLRRR
ncbi:spore gernimation protein GerPD [Salirhabdus salicampi]|uniref:spore gernimation protein GerPD n=1 Tax=Salirhabdus salicampi TaxID=476102 RepID=UPI0020C445E4|nr:spore gernimation protein GerPD [Salirhabdus salicampi]MCP8615542.1 spore gernimation protein GerPD [Salirhabdus salicampi]